MFLPLLTIVVLAAAPDSTVSVRAELRPLQYLVGQCWSAKFPNGTATDTHCFESVYGGAFIRDRHVVRGLKGPYEGETIYAWDPKQKKLVYTYWASDGGTSSGTAEPGAEGELLFHESYSSSEQKLELKTVWTRRADDGYDVRVSQQKDGAWAEMWHLSFRRDDGAAPGETKK